MHNDIAQIIKSLAAALVLSLVYVLLFALAAKLFGISSAVVKPVNQVFKILIIAVGGFMFLRGEKRFVKGAVYGLFAALCTYLLYGAIGGSLTFSWLVLAELGLGALAGLIGGVFSSFLF